MHQPNEDKESVDQDGRVIVFTNGSRKSSQNNYIQVAGSGVWFGLERPNNLGFPLPGKSQGSDRAEVYAVALAMELDPRRLHIKSDSSYVVTCFEKMQRQEAEIPRQINYDLWERIRCQILQYPDRVVVRKTKGHATAYHILRGKSTIFEKHGNDQADLLAEQGAIVNSPPRELLLLCKTTESK